MLINLCRYGHFLETCCFSSDAGTPAASVMTAWDAPCCWGGRDFYSFYWLLARRGNCRLDAFRESSRVLRSPLVCNMPMALLCCLLPAAHGYYLLNGEQQLTFASLTFCLCVACLRIMQYPRLMKKMLSPTSEASLILWYLQRTPLVLGSIRPGSVFAHLCSVPLAHLLHMPREQNTCKTHLTNRGLEPPIILWC